MEQVTEERLAPIFAGTAVIVGIGNVMRGDDAFGPMVAGRLEGRIHAEVVDAGTVPENFLGKIASVEPDTVMLVDAGDFGGEPGDIALLEPNELATTSFSTHVPALALLESFLEADRRVRVILLAAQPKHGEFGTPISDEMAAAVEITVRLIDKADRRVSRDDQ